MPSRETLIELAAHMEWADALVWSTLLQSAPARDDAAAKGWLHHLHTVQRVFVSNWRGQPLQLTEIASFETVPALAAWGRAGVSDLRAFLADADPDTLARAVEMPWAQRFAATTGQVTHPTLARSALHLALHSAHHRGQINVRLRALGAEPPLVDYIAWIWKGQPEAQWPRNVPAPGDSRGAGHI
jgi:uncharacterized damage-inducible protein DinB